MDDDECFEYIDKFVTKHAYDPVSAGSHLLNEGTLNSAKFNEDGSAKWRTLDKSYMNLFAEFGDLAEILVNTRGAAGLVGETPMVRPESGAVHPDTGEVFVLPDQRRAAWRWRGWPMLSS